MFAFACELHTLGRIIIYFFILGRKYECIEIPATHIYMLNIITNKLKLYGWENDTTIYTELEMDDWVKSMQCYQSLPDEEFTFDSDVSLNLDDEVF